MGVCEEGIVSGSPFVLGCFSVLRSHFGMIPLYGFAYCLLCFSAFGEQSCVLAMGGQWGKRGAFFGVGPAWALVSLLLLFLLLLLLLLRLADIPF